MKKMMLDIFLLITLILIVGFKVGDEVELIQFVKGRFGPKFLSSSHNVLVRQLDQGTKGEIEEIHQFFHMKNGKKTKGNQGIKLKITSGPYKGKSYWVYYKKADPSLKFLVKKEDEHNDEYREVASAAEATSAEVMHSTAAYADPSDPAILMEDIAKVVDEKFKATAIDQDLMIKNTNDCFPENNYPNEKALEVVATPKLTYGPLQALEDLNASDLKFMGRDKMPGSDQNSACLFQNDKAYIVYNNCMANKVESIATDIRVISKKDGGILRFYNEVFDLKTPNSQLKRSEYKGTWELEYIASKIPGELDVNSMKKYLSESDEIRNACWIGDTGKANTTDQKASCNGDRKDEFFSDWSASAEDFWLNTPDIWLSSQLKLRQLIINTSILKNPIGEKKNNTKKSLVQKKKK